MLPPRVPRTCWYPSACARSVHPRAPQNLAIPCLNQTYPRTGTTQSRSRRIDRYPPNAANDKCRYTGCPCCLGASHNTAAPIIALSTPPPSSPPHQRSALPKVTPDRRTPGRRHFRFQSASSSLASTIPPPAPQKPAARSTVRAAAPKTHAHQQTTKSSSPPTANSSADSPGPQSPQIRDYPPSYSATRKRPYWLS